MGLIVNYLILLHTQKKLEFLGGWGGDSVRPKDVKKSMKLPRGVRKQGVLKKSFPQGRYGYFLDFNIEFLESNISLFSQGPANKS